MSEKNTANTNEPLKSHFWLLLIFYTILFIFPMVEDYDTKISFMNGLMVQDETIYFYEDISNVGGGLLLLSLVVASILPLISIISKKIFIKRDRFLAASFSSMILSIIATLNLFYFSEFVLLKKNFNLNKTFYFYICILLLWVIIVKDYRAVKKLVGKNEKSEHKDKWQFYLRLLVFYLIISSVFYVVTLSTSALLSKQEEVVQELPENVYQQRDGEIRDFQKIADFAIAIDGVGTYSLTEHYLLAYSYNIPYMESQDTRNAEKYRKDTQAYYKIDIYQSEKDMTSHRKIDLKEIVHQYNKDYMIVTSFFSNQTPIKSGGEIYQPFEVIASDLNIKDLYLNLKTLKIEENVEEQGAIKIYNSSVDLTTYQSKEFRNQLDALTLEDEQTSSKMKNLLMLPYQEGVELQLYQEYPHILEMAKKGLYEIRITEEVNKTESQEFMRLFNRVESP
ncbi:hypothetical protein [uncultured Streptococcus sp.]|uniref:hypothetical protein n=1 Tax=uncultured Streptococcus sp. TaxID=83427 RepID=UPI0025D22F60|nr:hypothetical protein [uncultured Streptococcus sp.]